jgi:hypothetical protein
MALKTEDVGRERYSVYLSKAAEFYALMKNAEEKELWNGVGLNAIHCAISSCDALTTFYLGLRSRGEKHEDIVQLMKRVRASGIEERIKQLLDVLAIKNLVEYEALELGEKDARNAAKQAERIYLWAKQTLP